MTKEERILSEIEIALDGMSEKERYDFLKKCGFVLESDFKVLKEPKKISKNSHFLLRCGNNENSNFFSRKLKKLYN
ncbi:hypothetical protein B5F08_05725 [Anaeromassilibacillus sp. An172]|uniref:hypothetical protein n=1 Tax=Anaeromassilibacillus sp. An172 TaxID=1965570 RepID=UPI000B387927|nr:hypothetical protein [Anaeromassilibacillus sp. An172]OUP78913.1 hypothetical protein B5F08_05725 [Anaeromassilibacillus sp. An172]